MVSISRGQASKRKQHLTTDKQSPGTKGCKEKDNWASLPAWEVLSNPQLGILVRHLRKRLGAVLPACILTGRQVPNRPAHSQVLSLEKVSLERYI